MNEFEQAYIKGFVKAANMMGGPAGGLAKPHQAAPPAPVAPPISSSPQMQPHTMQPPQMTSVVNSFHSMNPQMRQQMMQQLMSKMERGSTSGLQFNSGANI